MRPVEFGRVKLFWLNAFGKPTPKDAQFFRWLQQHEPEVICDAIKTTKVRSARWNEVDRHKFLDRAIQECSRICNESTYKSQQAA